jgi:hypothetical protein
MNMSDTLSKIEEFTVYPELISRRIHSCLVYPFPLAFATETARRLWNRCFTYLIRRATDLRHAPD